MSDAIDTKNKLARALSEEQLVEFLEQLAATPGVDGPMIREQALARFGVSIGNDSANQFRKEVFGKYIDRIRKRRELSAVIAAHRDTDAGKTIADAASEELQQQVFEYLGGEPLDLSSKEGMTRAEALARIIKSARSEDRAMLDQLSERVKALEAEKRAAQKVLDQASGKGASPALIKSVRAALNFRPVEAAEEKGAAA